MEEPIEVTPEIIPSDKLEVAYSPAVFTDNLEALSAYVDKEIAPYVGAEIDIHDNEMVKEARKCMADLNKLKKPIEDERKRIKKIYTDPLKAFEAEVKTITTKIDQAREGIKKQVDEADENFKAWRRGILEEEYEGCAGVLTEIIPFSAVLEDEWLNRSTGEMKAKKQLQDKLERALKGYNTLQEKNLVFKDKVVKHFAETLDVIEALELEDRLNAEAAELEAFKARQAEAQKVAESRVEPEPIPEATSTPIPAPESVSAPLYTWELHMEFTGTKDRAEAVAEALKQMGITGATIKCKGVANG